MCGTAGGCEAGQGGGQAAGGGGGVLPVRSGVRPRPPHALLRLLRRLVPLRLRRPAGCAPALLPRPTARNCPGRFLSFTLRRMSPLMSFEGLADRNMSEKFLALGKADQCSQRRETQGAEADDLMLLCLSGWQFAEWETWSPQNSSQCGVCTTAESSKPAQYAMMRYAITTHWTCAMGDDCSETQRTEGLHRILVHPERHVRDKRVGGRWEQRTARRSRRRRPRTSAVPSAA